MGESMKEKFTLKDVVTIVGAIAAIAFHAGTYASVKEVQKDQQQELRLLKHKAEAHGLIIENHDVRISALESPRRRR